jgi:hypothetical protein
VDVEGEVVVENGCTTGECSGSSVECDGVGKGPCRVPSTGVGACGACNRRLSTLGIAVEVGAGRPGGVSRRG